MTTIRISIDLDYDLESHYNNEEEYKNLSIDKIVNDLEDTVYDDLTDLMRGDRLISWAEAKRLS